MNKKGLLGGLTALSILVVAAVGFASTSNKGLFGGSRNDFKAAQAYEFNRLGLTTAFADGVSGTVSTNANKDFILTVNSYVEVDAWKAKILMNNMSVETGGFYKASMTLTSTVAHNAFFVAEEGRSNEQKRMFWIDGNKEIAIYFQAERSDVEIQLQVGEFGGSTITVSDAKIEKLMASNLQEALTFNGRVDGDYYARNGGYEVDNNNVTVRLNAGDSSSTDKWKLKVASVISSEGRLAFDTNKMYRLKYTVNLNVAFPENGIDILLGGYPQTTTDLWDYTAQILGGNNDDNRLIQRMDLSNYDVKDSFTTEVAFKPLSAFYDLLISVECANVSDEAFNVVFSNIELQEFTLTDGEEAIATYRANKFANEWKAMRVDGKLCNTETHDVLDESALRAKIDEYINLPESVRNKLDTIIDTGAYTISDSVLYFAEKLGIN